MKKFFALLLAALLVPAAALAEDLAAMTTEELTALRLSIDQELASRAGSEAAQVLSMQGVTAVLERAEVCAAKVFSSVTNDWEERQALVILLRFSNATDKDFLVQSSFDWQALLDGVLLQQLQPASDTATLSDGSLFQPHPNVYGHIRPGSVGQRIGFGFVLPNGATGTVDFSISRNWISDGYGGTLSIPLQ